MKRAKAMNKFAHIDYSLSNEQFQIYHLPDL